MCQRGVPSKGAWGRGGAATLEGGCAALSPSGEEGQTETPFADVGCNCARGHGNVDFEFVSILSLVADRVPPVPTLSMIVFWQ